MELESFNSLNSIARKGWMPTQDESKKKHSFSSPFGSRLHPLTFQEGLLKYSKPCSQLFGVNSVMALLCVVFTIPYMTWAAWAGNYTTLAAIHKNPPAWGSNLEHIDTLYIGVCT